MTTGACEFCRGARYELPAGGGGGRPEAVGTRHSAQVWRTALFLLHLTGCLALQDEATAVGDPSYFDRCNNKHFIPK